MSQAMQARDIPPEPGVPRSVYATLARIMLRQVDARLSRGERDREQLLRRRAVLLKIAGLDND